MKKTGDLVTLFGKCRSPKRSPFWSTFSLIYFVAACSGNSRQTQCGRVVSAKKHDLRHAFSDPVWIQTRNLLIRSQMLYSIELRGSLPLSFDQFVIRFSQMGCKNKEITHLPPTEIARNLTITQKKKFQRPCQTAFQHTEKIHTSTPKKIFNPSFCHYASILGH